MVRVRRHGGQCCAISHVYDILWGQTPSLVDLKHIKILIIKACNRAYNNNLKRGYWRPQLEGFHLIEIVTAEREGGMGQTSCLRPILEELGFREINSVKNGNSGNICTIFHLAMSDKI